MKFYKKNPAIEGAPWVCGKEMTDEAVVCGDDFAPFANPNTFPGRPPKLVEVPFESLTEAQKAQAKGLAMEQASRPPKHLGTVTSDNIPDGTPGAIEIATTPKDMGTKKKQAPKPAAPKVETTETREITEDEIDKTFSGKMPSLKDYYGMDEFVETFPGVTDGNAKKILKAFKDLDALSTASNSSLRKAGVQPNFFDRVRKKAKSEVKSFNRKKKG